SAIDHGSRESPADFLDQQAAITLQFAHFRVRVENGNACLRKHLGDGGLAHADRTGQCDPDHCRSDSLKRASNWESKCRGASFPNNKVKLSAACSMSKARPSIVFSPFWAADLSNAVSAGSVTM